MDEAAEQFRFGQPVERAEHDSTDKTPPAVREGIQVRDRPLGQPVPRVEDRHLAARVAAQQAGVAGGPERVIGRAEEPHHAFPRHERQRHFLRDAAIRGEPIDAAALHGHEQAAVGLGVQAEHWQWRGLDERFDEVEAITRWVKLGEPVGGSCPDRAGRITRHRGDVSYLEWPRRLLGDHSRPAGAYDHLRRVAAYDIDERIAGADEQRAIGRFRDRRRHYTRGKFRDHVVFP